MGISFSGCDENYSSLWNTTRSDFPTCRTAYLLFFQNNLNLLRDMAVLIARDFKSKPAQSQLLVLHRYRGVRGKGGSGILPVWRHSHLSDTLPGWFIKQPYQEGE